MSKAYVVSRTARIECEDVEGVFTTLDKAEAFASKLRDKLKAQFGEFCLVSVEIEEYEMDKDAS